MIKLNAGFSRKVGEPNYGSRGASVNVDLELESSLIGDTEALSSKIRNLFDIARQAVDAELNHAPSNSQGQNPPNGNGHDRLDRGGVQRSRPTRQATDSQVRAIRSICDRLSRNADHLAADRFQANAVEDLTLREASSLIDELKAVQTHGGNGGRR